MLGRRPYGLPEKKIEDMLMCARESCNSYSILPAANIQVKLTLAEGGYKVAIPEEDDFTRGFIR